MKRSLAVAALATAAVLSSPLPASAAPKGHGATGSASCSVAGSVVTAAGLPTDQVINFLVTDGTGTSGWVLGYTPDGTWSVNVPAANGPTTYQFVSRTWGPSGSKYNVFAACS